jgi:hypothetical protein
MSTIVTATRRPQRPAAPRARRAWLSLLAALLILLSTSATALGSFPIDTPGPSVSPAAVGPSPEDAAAFGAWVRVWLDETGTASVAVATIDGGQPVFAEGYGAADRERGIPATADSIYLLASSSKPVVGLAAMRLVDDGRLDLDARVLSEASIAEFERVQYPRLDPMTGLSIESSPIGGGEREYFKDGGESGASTFFLYRHDGSGYVLLINGEPSLRAEDRLMARLERFAGLGG